jgi:hypothetical protein
MNDVRRARILSLVLLLVLAAALLGRAGIGYGFYGGL